MELSDFNIASDAEAGAAVRMCADIPGWVDSVLAARPFFSVADLLTHAHSLALGWTRQEVDRALATDPFPDQQRAAARTRAASEQGTIAHDPDTVARLLAGNQEYEQRFGRTFLIRAEGRDADDILAALERRLDNDDDSEWQETASHLRDIALARLTGQITDSSRSHAA